jgi:hypothetical protein
VQAIALRETGTRTPSGLDFVTQGEHVGTYSE